MPPTRILVFQPRNEPVTAPFSIREAVEEDLDRVRDIKVDNWAGTYGPLVDPAVLRPYLDRRAQLDALRKQLVLPGTSLLVAVDEPGMVIAFALFYPVHHPEPWMESLHVALSSRGRGAGTLLMRATAFRLQAGGRRSLRLGVVVGNDAAARFYERLGGVMIGKEPADWADGVWHWIYRWPDLSPLMTAAGTPAE